MKVITFTKKHNQEVADLVLDIQQNEFNVPVTLVGQPDLLDVQSFFQKDKGNFWVAISNGKVVGTIGLIDCGDGVGCLRKMFVHHKFRGTETGTARKLLAELENWAVKKGFKSIYLGTIERLDAAIKFYLKNGFSPIEMENLPASFPKMAVDTHFFVKMI